MWWDPQIHAGPVRPKSLNNPKFGRGYNVQTRVYCQLNTAGAGVRTEPVNELQPVQPETTQSSVELAYVPSVALRTDALQLVTRLLLYTDQ